MFKEKKKKEIIINLKQRFADGEKLTIEEIITEYYQPNSPYTYLVAKASTRAIVTTIKGWFRKKHGLWFGNINSGGKYGLFTTENEVIYGMTRYYRFIKGVTFNANILVKNAREKNLLPSNIATEKMLVARVKEEND